jgi:hypothetical protein
MDNEDLSIITKTNSLQIYNSEINDNDNDNKGIDYNSLFSFIDKNKENEKLEKENSKLKKILNNLFSFVKEFNDKIENLKKELS